MSEGQKWREYCIAVAANLAAVCSGLCMGWSSPVLYRMTISDNHPLGRIVTATEASWIGALLPLGAVFGPALAGVLIARIGRKGALLSTSLPLMAGWILVLTARHIAMIYVARVLWGLATALIYMTIPLYIGEVVSDNVRGALNSLLTMFILAGFLIMYAVGPYMSYAESAFVSLGFTILFTVTFAFVPESPYYHLLKGNCVKASKCLGKARGQSIEGIKDELKSMQDDVALMLRSKAKISDLWSTIGNIRGVYISTVLVIFEQLSGIVIILFYMVQIFEASGSALDYDISTITVGAVQVMAGLIAPLAVDRVGRRLLLYISTIGMALGLGMLGLYFFLDSIESQIIADGTIDFLPILSLMIYIIMFCVGIGPIPWTLMGEIFPANLKPLIAPLASTVYWTIAFFLTFFFEYVSDSLGMHTVFWFFTACCLVGCAFSFFFVPETKGKSLMEIQMLLNERSSKHGGEHGDASVRSPDFEFRRSTTFRAGTKEYT